MCMQGQGDISFGAAYGCGGFMPQSDGAALVPQACSSDLAHGLDISGFDAFLLLTPSFPVSIIIQVLSQIML